MTLQSVICFQQWGHQRGENSQGVEGAEAAEGDQQGQGPEGMYPDGVFTW